MKQFARSPSRLAFAAGFVLLAAAAGHAQLSGSKCADCHFANPKSMPAWHQSEWDHSAHHRAGVGCEGCHGGNPRTFESFLAHQSIVKAGVFGSPLHSTNLPKTCGACHPGPYRDFQLSKHYQLLREGNEDVPTCTTCHGAVGAFTLSPKSLAAECARCHGPGKVAPRGDYPAEGKLNLEAVREVRKSLHEAKGLVRRIKDKERRADLQAELEAATFALTGAVDSAHRFVYGEMQQRMIEARKRTDLLLEELANPHPTASK